MSIKITTNAELLSDLLKLTSIASSVPLNLTKEGMNIAVMDAPRIMMMYMDIESFLFRDYEVPEGENIIVINPNKIENDFLSTIGSKDEVNLKIADGKMKMGCGNRKYSIKLENKIPNPLKMLNDEAFNISFDIPSSELIEAIKSGSSIDSVENMTFETSSSSIKLKTENEIEDLEYEFNAENIEHPVGDATKHTFSLMPLEHLKKTLFKKSEKVSMKFTDSIDSPVILRAKSGDVEVMVAVACIAPISN